MSDTKVLVMEDEQPLIEAISTKLKTTGFQVVSARSVEQGLNLLKDKVEVDIIWLDHYLFGKEDGLDFVAQIKKSDEWKNIPIFVVSNTASPDKVKHYMQLGVDKYYIKAEHRLDEIISEITKCCNKSE
ncbi:MAG: response regulator [Candidatus Berkelbacteria bacterium]